MKPNWKNKKDYDFKAGTSLDRWAAEFLWRNEKFRKELEAAKSSQDWSSAATSSLAWSASPAGKVLKRWGVSRPVLPDWVKRGLTDSYLIFEKYPRYVQSYEVTTAGGLFTENAIGQRYLVAQASENKSAIEFDLLAPINPQIERAKKMLHALQKQDNKGAIIVKKAKVKLYPVYLRILDAGAVGVTNVKILEVFGKEFDIGEDTLSKQKKEAERLRDGGYREIVTAPAAW